MTRDRVFQQKDGYWYFRIRGNATMGPYANYREADMSLGRYVESCRAQSELSPGWPRWMHFKYWSRRLTTDTTGAPKPTEI